MQNVGIEKNKKSTATIVNEDKKDTKMEGKPVSDQKEDITGKDKALEDKSDANTSTSSPRVINETGEDIIVKKIESEDE